MQNGICTDTKLFCQDLGEQEVLLKYDSLASACIESYKSLFFFSKFESKQDKNLRNWSICTG